MFRDTYKAANCDITPDSKFVSQVLSQVEQAEKKPAVIPFRAIAACAAAFVVMAGSVFGYIRYTEMTTLRVAPRVIMSDSMQQDTQTVSQNDKDIKAEVTAKADDEQTIKKGSNASEAATKSTSEKESANEGYASSTAKSTEKANRTATSENNRKNTNPAPSENTSGTESTAPAEPNAQNQPAYTSDAPLTEANDGSPSAENTEKEAAIPAQESTTEPPAEDYAPKVFSAYADTDTSSHTPDNGVMAAAEHPGDTGKTPQNETGGNNQPASGGGSGMMAARMAPGQEETYDETASVENSAEKYDSHDPDTGTSREISYSQYCEYIGYDLYEKLEVPEDLKPQKWDKTGFNEANDEVALTYKGDNNRFAQITPTKNTAKIYDSINSSTDAEKSENSALSYSSESAVAYIVSGNVGYTVSCSGLDEKEFSALTGSISK